MGEEKKPRDSSAFTGQVPASSGPGRGAGGGGAGASGGGGASATAFEESAGASAGGSFVVAPAGGDRRHPTAKRRQAPTVARYRRRADRTAAANPITVSDELTATRT
jgi:hypothetical protein